MNSSKDNPMKPTFSFVIPVYNAEKFLPRCLESVLAQTCKDFEVVVVDDCSKGNCCEIVEAFRMRLPHIHYVRHEKNKSALQARITGAVHASGQYIVPVDPDDYVHPCLIEKLKNAIKDDKWTIVVYQTEFVDKNGKVVFDEWHNHVSTEMSLKGMFDELIASKVTWTMWGKAFYRKHYLASIKWVHIKDNTYINNSDDLCLMVPQLIGEGRVKFIEYLGYRYCWNSGGLTKNIASASALKSPAQQCQACIDLLVEACIRHDCKYSVIVKIQSLLEQIIKWHIGDLEDLSPRSWSECINMLCTVHDSECVLRLASQCCPDILKRYTPTKAIIPPPLRDEQSKRTIGIICRRFSGGGTERATLLWAQEMTTRGYSVVWLCDEGESPKKGNETKFHRFTILELPITDWCTRWQAIKEATIKHKIGLFLLPDYYRDQILRDLLLVKSLGRKVIVAEHTMYFAALEVLCFDLYKERARFYPLADAVTVLSPENVAWWHAAGLQSVIYMPNLLTFDVKTSKPRNLLRQQTGSFLCVGRICESKQQNKVLEAFAKYREMEQEPRTSRLTLLGGFFEPGIEQKIRAQIECLDLKAAVDIPGECADVAPYYRRADILLMASRFEGAPMVINEAKAKGLPVIMFDLPYVEGTRPGEGVVTVPMNDVEAMAREMKSCMTDKKKYERLSQEGRKSLKKYETGTVMKRWEKLLDVVESHTITPERLEPMCEAVSPERMLPMTMNEISSFVSAIQSRWDSLWGENYAIAADRDRICGERRFWESEFQRISNSRSFKIGRAVTWPLRMVRNSFLVLRYEGFAAFCRRVPRKIANLKRRFFG